LTNHRDGSAARFCRSQHWLGIKTDRLDRSPNSGTVAARDASDGGK
jgi:hypothetical protein